MRLLKASLFLSIALIIIVYGWNNFYVSEQTREVGEFNAIYTSGPINVFIKQAEQSSVMVRADDAIHSQVSVTVEKGILRIDQTSRIEHERVLDVFINYTSLDSIHASGVSTVTARGILNSSKLTVKVSGAAEIKLPLTTDSLKLVMSRSANVQLAGTVDYLDISLTGVGDLMAYNLLSQSCKAIVQTSDQSPGVLRINVEKTLSINIEGSRHIKYKGAPEITNIEIEGDGRVIKD